MREFARPRTGGVPIGNLTDDVVRHATVTPDRPLFAVRAGDGWSDVSAAEFHGQVRAVARGLVAAGVSPGARVALLCSTRLEWTVLDYAIWFAGAVSVPLYASSSPEQVATILRDCGASAALVETAEQQARVRDLSPPGQLTAIWCLDDGDLDALVRSGSQIEDELVEQRRAALTSASVATLVYTSGTTGEPKGCTLTHGNFMSEVRAAVTDLDAVFDDDASTLLFLPLAHIFARVVQVGAVHMGVRLAYSSDVRRLLDDLESFAPTFVLAVPRVFEKLYTGVSLRAAADGRGRLFERASRTAIAHSRASGSGRPSRRLRARHALYDRLVFASLRKGLGGRCCYAIAGGAPLGERLAHFFRGIGLTVLEGYGLTETTGAVTLNTPDHLKLGTVGRPLAGTAVRVDEDGELLVRGDQVMTCYWTGDDQSRDEPGTEEWLRTGDLGEIDDEGFVRVIGRKQEILVTAGGKHVAPSALEDRIRQHPLVEQCVVVGDSRPYLAALVTLDAQAAREWASSLGREDVHRAEDDAEVVRLLHHDDALRTSIQAAIDDANTTVSQAASVRRFEVLPVQWTEEGGQLTPSLKVRRMVVMQELRSTIESLYD